MKTFLAFVGNVKLAAQWPLSWLTCNARRISSEYCIQKVKLWNFEIGYFTRSWIWMFDAVRLQGLFTVTIFILGEPPVLKYFRGGANRVNSQNKVTICFIFCLQQIFVRDVFSYCRNPSHVALSHAQAVTVPVLYFYFSCIENVMPVLF